jgi:peptidyl-tRNA hydrolase, PTH1 family
MTNMYLIVGLGNPGKKYEHTRHNVGFMVLDRLRERHIRFEFPDWREDKKFQADITGSLLHNQKIILAKPTTFMNNSGEAVRNIASYYQIPSDKIIIVHDDKDINLGEVRVQKDRGDAGHNGVRSIFKYIDKTDSVRIRVGIKNKKEKKMADISKFVLGKFGLFERKTLDQSIDIAVEKIIS